MAFDAVKRPLLALALGASILSVANVAARAEEGGVFDFALGMLGLGNDDKPEITYRERPPLVVPPKMQLPPPQQAASVGNSAWPSDPDVQRRKKAEEERKRPRSYNSEHELNRPLTAAERAAGYRPDNGISAGTPGGRPFWVNADHDWNDPAMIKELERQNQDVNMGDGPRLAPGQEPERRYLTDPPTGYRKPSSRAAVDLPPEPAKPRPRITGQPGVPE